MSESTKRNLYMAPGVLLIAGVLAGDACSTNQRRRVASEEAQRVVQEGDIPGEFPRLVNAETRSVEREAGFRIE